MVAVGDSGSMILDPPLWTLKRMRGQILERINGYVHQLQAVDKRMDTDFVSLIIRFVDEDPAKDGVTLNLLKNSS